MATDPVPALLALIKDRPDPRAVSSWIVAYLGKRDAKDRKRALASLQAEFEARKAADPRGAGMVLGIVAKLQAD
jgi:hypothetical protein